MPADYYPPVSFYFEVKIDGFNARNDSSFQEVSGLSAKLEVSDIVEGGENRFVHRVPVRANYENLILKRGLLAGSAMISWIEDAILHFKFAPRLVTISLLSPPDNSNSSAGSPLAKWKFVNAYPVSWSLSDLKSSSGELAIETLELAYQYSETVPV